MLHSLSLSHLDAAQETRQAVHGGTRGDAAVLKPRTAQAEIYIWHIKVMFIFIVSFNCLEQFNQN